MKIFVFLSLLLFISCSSQQQTKQETLSKIEVIVPPPHPQKRDDARTIYFEKIYRGNDLDPILQKVANNINNKTYVLSSVLPPNVQIRRDKAIHFIEKPLDQKINKNDSIEIHLEKNTKYLSYKLSIHYYDKRSRKKIRNWLFSLNYSDDQIEKSIQKTIIRFAFQSL